MNIFNSYLFRNLFIATLFVAFTLTFVIFLTQSLRFLEIVINAGSSGRVFVILTGLALPRFFEIILPLSVMASTLFIYNKMTIDSELIAMRATGHSSFALALPAIILGLLVSIMLWGITMWVAPSSLAKMQSMRQELKAEFSSFIFREGIFNSVGKGLTVYIRDRTQKGELSGLMIYDTRDTTKLPSTVLAKRGIIVANEEGHQVIVYNGSRQEYNPKTKILQKLAFDRYTIDLPEGESVRQRWAEPDERTIIELLNPDPNNKRDIESLRTFKVEIHRRLTSPLLALTFPLIALSALLLGPVDRKGQTYKIAIALIAIMIIQSLFLTSYNFARKNDIGVILMYILTFMPILLCLFSLSPYSEELRRNLFYSKKEEVTP
ncbi:MAG: LPS export ABC transporter permease LptF [Alphaproteobacteria bacterium]